MREAWYLSRYTGLFRASGAAPLRAHDPAVAVWSGTPANRPPGERVDAVGGAGWTDEAAELAAVGEAIERWQTHALPRDRVEPRPVDPAQWVLYSDEQYALPEFPFVPLPGELPCVQFRRVADGEPVWVPAELAFMDLRAGARHRFGPAISTGWSAHRTLERAVLRGVQEVIERDALMGGWWGIYPLEVLEPPAAPELARPNLTYRAYRIASPCAAHVTMVTVEGEDREGYCFAIGSACRETRAESLHKATLEAVQGRHYVRYLRRETAAAPRSPRTFAEHAVAYSFEPARLAGTALARAGAATADPGTEPLADLLRRVAPLYRIATPPAFADLGWVVVRVMIPRLQPMHGDHALPFLGGLWRGRSLAEFAALPPHPFA